MSDAAAGAPSERERIVIRRATAFGIAAGLIALSFGPRIGLSVLAGAGVTIANLLLLRRVVAGLNAALSARAAVAAALLTALRYLLLAAVLAAIISLGDADPIGVLCGLGAPLLAVLLEAGNAGFNAFRSPPPASDSSSSDESARGSTNPPSGPGSGQPSQRSPGSRQRNRPDSA